MQLCRFKSLTLLYCMNRILELRLECKTYNSFCISLCVSNQEMGRFKVDKHRLMEQRSYTPEKVLLHIVHFTPTLLRLSEFWREREKKKSLTFLMAHEEALPHLFSLAPQQEIRNLHILDKKFKKFNSIFNNLNFSANCVTARARNWPGAPA